MARGASTMAETDIPSKILLICCICSIKLSIKPRISWREDDDAQLLSSSLMIYYSYISFFIILPFFTSHLWIDNTIVFKPAGLVSHKRHNLCFKVFQIFCMHVKFIDVKVVFFECT